MNKIRKFFAISILALAMFASHLLLTACDNDEAPIAPPNPVEIAPPVTSRLLGQQEFTMIVGETAKIPNVEITINNRRFVTSDFDVNSQGFVLTEDIHPELGRRARVGIFEILFWSENGSMPEINHNSFTPFSVDTYWFTYRIVINDLQEQGKQIIPELDLAEPPIIIEQTWRVTIEPIRRDHRDGTTGT